MSFLKGVLNSRSEAFGNQFSKKKSSKKLSAISDSKPILYVDVLRAKNVLKKGSKKPIDTYVMVEFEETEFTTEIQGKKLEPEYFETFLFQVDSNQLDKELCIFLYQKHLLKDEILGSVVIPIKSLLDEKVHLEWKRMEKKASSNNSSMSNMDIPMLEVKLQYSASNKGKMNKLAELKKLEDYVPMVEYLQTLNPKFFSSHFDLSSVIPSPSDVQSLLHIVITNPEMNRSGILRYLVSEEVKHCEDTSTLFRSNGIASKIITQVCNRYGDVYLHKLLDDFAANLIAKKENLELDPAKVVGKVDVKGNMNKVRDLCQLLLDRMYALIGEIPVEIREILNMVMDEVKIKFKKEELARIGVGAIFFLRFICPAITSPQLYNIGNSKDAVVSKEVSRTFIFITKILQNLANNVQFGKKEPFMNKANKVIKNNTKKFAKFLEAISSQSEFEIAAEDFEYNELLWSCYQVHNYLWNNIEKLKSATEQNNASAFNFKLSEEDLKILGKYLEKLTNIFTQKLGAPADLTTTTATAPTTTAAAQTPSTSSHTGSNNSSGFFAKPKTAPGATTTDSSKSENDTNAKLNEKLKMMMEEVENDQNEHSDDEEGDGTSVKKGDKVETTPAVEEPKEAQQAPTVEETKQEEVVVVVPTVVNEEVVVPSVETKQVEEVVVVPTVVAKDETAPIVEETKQTESEVKPTKETTSLEVKNGEQVKETESTSENSKQEE